ncbi:protein kinase family protein [Bacillus sp. CGMCC 1.16607]|uniref:protein kinase family protein n=1 Tax=Bacillus sp. CGMCC 1.16607 TaxID=3351842 RepID=UPI0036260225
MKSFSDLAESVKFTVKGSKFLLNDKDSSLEFIGEGRSAFVFRIQSTNKVLKVFFPPFAKIAKEEAEIYRVLKDSWYYPTLYESGKNYLVIDYIQGYTLFSCLERGIPITIENMCAIDDALNLAKDKGLNPSDIHLRNIFITPTGSIKMIDVARFRQTKTCSQWKDIKAAFYRLYVKRLFPKKIPALYLNLLAYLYKKKLLPSLS